jgi:hypothetical protein
MNKTQSIFQSVFNQQWESLPRVIKMRYANRPFSEDIVTVKGHLNVHFSNVMKFFMPILGLFKILVPYQGENIPVTVKLRSENNLPGVYFDRTFYFPGKKPYRFCSYMQHIKDNNIVEFIRFGVGLSMKCSYNNKVLLEHNGYVWKIFGLVIPLPLSFIMGSFYAEEEPISDDSFHLLVRITHPLFGKIFEYNGILHISSN